MTMPQGPPTSRNLHQYHGESVREKFETENDSAYVKQLLSKLVRILTESIAPGAWIECVENNGLRSVEIEDRLTENKRWRAR